MITGPPYSGSILGHGYGSTVIASSNHQLYRKKTKVKQLGPRLAFGWVTIQGVDVDAVATNIIKSRKRRIGAHWDHRESTLEWPSTVHCRLCGWSLRVST